MSHPTPEEWMDYLYGELHGRARSKLKGHLADCPECRAAVSTWREAMGHLDAWRMPRQRLPAARRFARAAAAALLLMALGYAIGWLRPRPAVDVEALRAEWQASLSDARSQIEAELYAQLRADMEQLAAQTFAASNAVTNRLLNQFIEAYLAARAEEQEAIAAAFLGIERRRVADDVVLRDDLIALAALTGGELLRTRQDMATLLAYTYPVAPAPEEDAGTETLNEGRSE